MSFSRGAGEDLADDPDAADDGRAKITRDRYRGYLEDGVARRARRLRAYLDRILPGTRQGPVPDGLIVALGLKVFVDRRIGESGIAPDQIPVCTSYA